MKILLIIIMLLLNIVYTCKTSSNTLKSDVNDLVWHNVVATYYNATPEQCEGDHLITADGSHINLNKLRNGKIKWVAISRDLRKHYKFGDRITVISKNPKLNGEWIVKDIMGKRHKNRIDFLSYGRLLDTPEKVKIIKTKNRNTR